MTYPIDNKLTFSVIAAAMEVHSQLGPGMLESVYQHCLGEEFRLRKIPFLSQEALEVSYKGKLLDKVLILDFLIADQLIVEIKAIETILPVHEAQLVSYLRMAEKPLGLLINFNVASLKDGIKRKIYSKAQ